MTILVKPIIADLPHTAAMVGLSESTWQELVKTGRAPKPRQTSDRRVGWLVREVEAWAESRPVSDLPPPANTGAKKNRGNA